MKKYIYPFLSTLIGAIVFGVIGLVKFGSYGGNSCDMPGKSCDCFCCNSFGLRGYEACGDYGLLIGVITGAIVGIGAYYVYTQKAQIPK